MNYTRPLCPAETVQEIRRKAASVKGPLVVFVLNPIKNDYGRLKAAVNAMRQRRGIPPLETDSGFMSARAAIIDAMEKKNTVHAAELLLIESVRLTYEIDDHKMALEANHDAETEQHG